MRRNEARNESTSNHASTRFQYRRPHADLSRNGDRTGWQLRHKWTSSSAAQKRDDLGCGRNSIAKRDTDWTNSSIVLTSGPAVWMIGYRYGVPYRVALE